MNRTIRISIGILICIVGGIIASSGFIRYEMAVEAYTACLNDCFSGCTICSLSQSDVLRQEMDAASQMRFIWFIAGAGIFVMGLISGWPSGPSMPSSGGKNDKDIEKLRKAVSVRPDKAEFWNALSRKLIDMEYFDEAITDAKKAVDLEPDSASFWITLGEACQAAGDAEGATKAFQKSIALDPDQENDIGQRTTGSRP